MTTTIAVKDIPPFVKNIHVSGGEVSYEYDGPLLSFGGNLVMYHTLEEIKSVENPMTMAPVTYSGLIVPVWVPFKIIRTEKQYGYIQTVSGSFGWIVLDNQYLKKLSF